MDKNKMKRVQMYITTKENEFLMEYSEENSIGKSELIRRILDEWIEKKKLS